MMEIKEKMRLVDVIKSNLNEPVWELKYENFIMAFCEFMDFKRFDIDEYSIEEIERKAVIEDGKEKKQSVLKLKNENLIVVMTAYKENQWIFEFKEVTDTRVESSNFKTKVEKHRIVNVNGIDRVLLITDIASEDRGIYAIPVEVAESLMIPDYDGEEVSRDENFLYEISQYELERYIVHNYD